MTCTATPQQIVPPGTVTFTIQTFVTGGPSASNNRREPIWPRAAGGTALAVVGFFLLPLGRRARILASRSTRRFLVLLLLLAGLCGVGMGCNSIAGQQSTSSTGTPLGVSTFKITAAAYVDNTVVSQSVYLTVNVLPAP
jgi:drug/metabolite transporter (DMT)-like permease